MVKGRLKRVTSEGDFHDLLVEGDLVASIGKLLVCGVWEIRDAEDPTEIGNNKVLYERLNDGRIRRYCDEAVGYCVDSSGNRTGRVNLHPESLYASILSIPNNYNTEQEYLWAKHLFDKAGVKV